MSYYTVSLLDDLREYVGEPIKIHCGYEQRENNSHHTFGTAIDCSCPNISLFDFFLAASRFVGWGGIGVYPKWNNPGLHLDTRSYDKKTRAYWSRIDNNYLPLTVDIFIGV